MTVRTITDRVEADAALRGTDLHQIVDRAPDGTAFVVVEDAGAVVGTWAVIPYTHLEGAWVAPAHRGKGSVVKHLVDAAMTVCRERHLRAVLSAADSPEVEGLLRHLGGVELPGQAFVLPVRS